MRNVIGNIWTLGGLSLPDLARRTMRESWQDEVFGQGGRMAFYHFLAIFPSLVVFLSMSRRIPHLSSPMTDALQDLTRQVLPDQASQLLQSVLNELTGHLHLGVHLIPVCAGALWAAINGTWAMVYGLNHAYEVQEHRPWWSLAITIIALTLALAVTGCLAMLLIFCSGYVLLHVHAGIIGFRVLEWAILTALLFLSFAVLYRFAPNVQDPEWRWSLPGALCAVILWLSATFLARLYFEHVNSYARSYGHLNGVVMLLLWLYATNAAILIGGEMNSEINKAAKKHQTGTEQRVDQRAGVY
jgi:membrane protein